MFQLAIKNGESSRFHETRIIRKSHKSDHFSLTIIAREMSTINHEFVELKDEPIPSPSLLELDNGDKEGDEYSDKDIEHLLSFVPRIILGHVLEKDSPKDFPLMLRPPPPFPFWLAPFSRPLPAFPLPPIPPFHPIPQKNHPHGCDVRRYKRIHKNDGNLIQKWPDGFRTNGRITQSIFRPNCKYHS